MLQVAADLGHTPTLHLLDVARIKRHKKQRQNKECNSDRQKDAHLVLSKKGPYSTFRANCTLGSCVVLSVVEP